MYHFWYFPALIISMILASAFYKLKIGKALLPVNILCYALGCLLGVYYHIVKGIPLFFCISENPYYNEIRRILLMGFPFFASGSLVWKLQDKINRHLNVYTSLLLVAMTTAAWVLELEFARQMKWSRSIIISAGLYLFVVALLAVLVRFPHPQLAPAARICKKLANYMYYIHPMVIEVCTFCFTSVLGIAIPDAVLFFMTVAVCLVTGRVLISFDCKWIHKLIG